MGSLQSPSVALIHSTSIKLSVKSPDREFSLDESKSFSRQQHALPSATASFWYLHPFGLFSISASRQRTRRIRRRRVFGEAVGEPFSFHQRRPLVAHGAQFVALLRGSHPDDEVPALAGGDGQGPVHVLAPVEEPLAHPVFHLRTLGLA